MSTAAQLWALGQKDLQIARRSKCRCCCEMTIPLFMLPFIILILFFTRNISKIERLDRNDLLPLGTPPNALTLFDLTFPSDKDFQQFKASADKLKVKFPSNYTYYKTVVKFVEFDVVTPKFQYIFSNVTNNVYGFASSLEGTGWSNPYDGDSILDVRDPNIELLVAQFTIDAILINMQNVTRENKTVKGQYLPRPDYSFKVANEILPYLAILVVAASLIPAANAGKDVIVEVETEIKTYLLVLGMTRVSFYFSHFINGFIKVTLILILVMLPFVFVLQLSVGLAMIGLVILFSLVMVSFAMFWATILHRPGVCMTVIILSTIFLTVVAYIVSNDRLNVSLMCGFSLNPISALRMGFQDLRFYDRYGMSPWPGERIGYQFSAFLSAIFLLVDAIILIILALILDVILPSAGQSGINISGCIKRLKKNKVFVDEEQTVEKDDFELTRHKDINPDIEVLNLKKKWGGNYAVNGVTFSAYPGEITCLLGHNGAGKSTTFSCLTGYIKPTSGDLFIGGINVCENLTEARKNIGYCPQKNPLFDRLSCVEHLRLAAKLKGSYCGENDIHEVLNAVGLGNAMTVLASELSGGMKRKLCVALALVGKSAVCLFDEPSAGMDPIARKQIGDILDKYKKDRTILYTTHYMDEADQLSDKIVILVRGVVAACGSSSFLKKRFGTGFLLTITMNSDNQSIDEKVNRILEEIQVEIADSRLEGSPALQFVVNLPYESKVKFSELFTNLENKGAQLGIDSFGLSVNTLEQVFIKVGDKAEGTSSRELREKIIANAEIIRQEDDHRSPNCFKQLGALCIRNFTYWLRHPVRSLIPFIVVIICFGALFFIRDDGKKGLQRFVDESVDDSKLVLHSLSDLPASEILFTDPYGTSLKTLMSPLRQCKLINPIEFNSTKNWIDVPPPSLGLFDQNSEIYLMFNRYLRDGPFIVINLFSNLLFGKSFDTITFGYEGTIHNNDLGLEYLVKSALSSVVAIVGVTFGMAMLLSEVIIERVTKFKNQLKLAGINGIKYWTAQYTTDFLYFLVLAILVFLGSVVAAKTKIACSAGMLPILILYFFTASTASYFLSFGFQSPTKGVVFILAFHTIIPMITYVLLLMCIGLLSLLLLTQMKVNSADILVAKDYVDIIFGIFFPAMPLFSSQAQIYSICKEENPSFTDIFTTRVQSLDNEKRSILSCAGLQALISLPIGFLFYGFLLIMIEMKIFRRIRNKDIVMSNLPQSTKDDDDVMQERARIAQIQDSNLSLVCRSLYKYYNKSKCALENLSFGINPNECFGLLGINGAGKTTTFEILSGASTPSSGYATIEGVDVKLNPVIGYAPQFDALSEFLTANDTLRLIGRLNGFANVEERVKLVLQCVMMEEHADKIVKECSGGQKRRVSIAVSLMCGATFLMLDEPTAGVDPGTRRQIWDLLSAMRKQNKSILLTTHSMEECEALCGRIGFLRSGRLQAVGTSQHLKSRYGNSYLLTLVQSNPNKESASRIDLDVQNEFNTEPTQENYNMTSLSWILPRRSDISFGQMYTNVENYVEALNRRYSNAIKDFYLIQNSLESVFSRLAAIENAEVDNLYHPTPIQQLNGISQQPIQPLAPPTYTQQPTNTQAWTLPTNPQSSTNTDQAWVIPMNDNTLSNSHYKL